MDNIRVLTAAALFDGHDVSINLFRRLLQKRGAEVIHLGHNRSVREVITVAIEEDVDAILVSSYQGGHNEYFRYVVDLLNEHGAGHILVFGGGGGVILPREIKALEDYGVERLYHALDGQKFGIDGIADDIIARIKKFREENPAAGRLAIDEDVIRRNTEMEHYHIARQLTYLENFAEDDPEIGRVRELYKKHDQGKSIVLGFTGTGGSGKSSLIDELIGRFLAYTDDVRVGVLAVDPTKSRTGGALLGDRIRYNQIYNDRVYFRSFATRGNVGSVSRAINDCIAALKSCGIDLIIVETSGIGQGDSHIADIAEHTIYVMTSEFGGPSQLEKIDMLDVADRIAINKFEKVGSEDAFREVKINYIRNHGIRIDHSIPLEEVELPVYATSSNQFNNHGVNRLFKDILDYLKERIGGEYGENREVIDILPTSLQRDFGLIDNRRVNYLAEISDTVRKYHEKGWRQAKLAGEIYHLREAISQIEDSSAIKKLKDKFSEKWDQLDEGVKKFLSDWPETKKQYAQDELNYKIQDKDYSMKLYNMSICGNKIPKVLLPPFESWRDLVKYFFRENLPGDFPYTAGVFPFKRTTEDPKRQFAGEGSPERTNRRFHYLCEGDKFKRLSVAFDGITLYGEDPDEQPDIYGKIGESGVSICTLEDMDKLLDGFDQTDPLTSVSMTINAPAPIMVAFYFITAYKRELEKARVAGKELSDGDKEALRLATFRRLRGTVQADMLKEDQGQNTCIFSIGFAMKLIGDVQEYFSKNGIKNYYSISISGYHIAEAGANPITQLAFTLANGFTYVEYFLNRGMDVDSFAPNLSYFFSNGMDPEYSVIGRVARRIWAVAMREKYGANPKSQKLKYHIQTSGRSL
ncbi:MAG: methylmalonyl-CoA mutase family protein, partial [Bacteroidota bacterium]